MQVSGLGERTSRCSSTGLWQYVHRAPNLLPLPGRAGGSLHQVHLPHSFCLPALPDPSAGSSRPVQGSLLPIPSTWPSLPPMPQDSYAPQNSSARRAGTHSWGAFRNLVFQSSVSLRFKPLENEAVPHCFHHPCPPPHNTLSAQELRNNILP